MRGFVPAAGLTKVPTAAKSLSLLGGRITGR